MNLFELIAFQANLMAVLFVTLYFISRTSGKAVTLHWEDQHIMRSWLFLKVAYSRDDGKKLGTYVSQHNARRMVRDEFRWKYSKEYGQPKVKLNIHSLGQTDKS